MEMEWNIWKENVGFLLFLGNRVQKYIFIKKNVLFVGGESVCNF